MLKLINTNNYFGQHEFHLDSDLDAALDEISKARWFKKLRLVKEENKLIVFCFTNYDKATMERLFGNG